MLSSSLPIHLEDHLDDAVVIGSEPADDVPASIVWRFDEPQPGWKPASPRLAGWGPIELIRIENALRLSLNDRSRRPDNGRLAGALYVPVPDLNLDDWAAVEIRARTVDSMRNIGIDFNYTETEPVGDLRFYAMGESAPLFTDGTLQTYRIPLRVRPVTRPGYPYRERLDGPWTHLAIWCNTESGQPNADLDLLSVAIVSKESEYAASGAGVRSVAMGQISRRTVFTHAPGRIEFQVLVPDEARLDVGLGVVRDDIPVTFRVTAQTGAEAAETLLEQAWSDRTDWTQRSADLSHLAGRTVTLGLEAEAEQAGSVALWASPTVSGTRATQQPNVIFYVIDGAGADTMSVYGYNRATTPHLERIAAEGAVFERAYSNSSYTRPSTASFLTSLQHSVLGGLRNDRNPVPDQVLTLAEHFHRAGYQTGHLTTNPNAGAISGLERGVDCFRDAGARVISTSSVELHDNFWSWRQAFPGEPYLAHFQTTDVHEPHTPVAPFAGMFIDSSRKAAFDEMEQSDDFPWPPGFEVAAAGRDLYDETMAHQDAQLGRLVERLKATGEWERTLLIVAADHAAAAGSQDWGVLMLDDVPPNFDFTHRGTPILRSGVSRIPMIFVWPGRIAAGQRFSDPVSMIDMLPTILELAGLPPPEILQGQSLAPLLLGQGDWQPRPVIFDEFTADRQTGQLGGRIEVIDGRWGASLEINPLADPDDPGDRRPAPLLLYDLWNDPLCLKSLHEERRDLVQKYTEFLNTQWEAHQSLAQHFSSSGHSALTPEQLRTLRTLGYIQ